MKLRSNAVVLAALASGFLQAQDVSMYSTTIAQMWKADTPGFDKNTYTPATEFLGIDANNLGTDALSLHLFGWGRADLADKSIPEGNANGYLSYGFLQYRFSQANAEIKAGRFAVNQGVGVEMVDGVSARADLIGGFSVSAFGGRPVLFRTHDPVSQQDYEFQRDILAGARIAWSAPKFGEVGISYLQDGTTAAKDLPVPSNVDYSRRQLGVDLRVAPISIFEFSGRTVFDVAKHPDVPAGTEKPSNIAEHDYTLTVKAADQLRFTGTFTERNFFAFFAGTNLPSLFQQDERDKFRAHGGSVIWSPAASLQITGDYRHTDRETYGSADRFGVDVQWTQTAMKLKSGFGFHKVNADDVLQQMDPLHPSYSISNSEFRAWVMYEKGKLFSSFDAIVQAFDDKNNPHLNGQSTLWEAVGSVGIQATENLRISGDLSYAATAIAKKEVMGLLRAEYRFGTSRKGGAK